MPLAILLGALLAPLHFCMGCNFAGAQLGAAQFGGGIYVGANFAGAFLERADFRGAKLVAANFQGADLRSALFDGAQCTACNFEGTKLDGASFAGAGMVAANFDAFKATLADASLRGLLSGCMVCNFRGASLTGRDLSGVTLMGNDFSQADLRGTKFDGAAICWYVVNGAQRTTKCDAMKNALVAGASFRGVRICEDPTRPTSCIPVTAAALRSGVGSSLDGALLP